jgi:histone H3/H4
MFDVRWDAGETERHISNHPISSIHRRFTAKTPRSQRDAKEEAGWIESKRGDAEVAEEARRKTITTVEECRNIACCRSS